MFCTAHGAYSGIGSSCRNLEWPVLVTERIDHIVVYQIDNIFEYRPISHSRSDIELFSVMEKPVNYTVSYAWMGERA